MEGHKRQFYRGEYSIDRPSRISYEVENIPRLEELGILMMGQIQDGQSILTSNKSLPITITMTCYTNNLFKSTVLVIEALMGANNCKIKSVDLLELAELKLKEQEMNNSVAEHIKRAAMSNVPSNKIWTIRLSQVIKANDMPAVTVTNQLGERARVTVEIADKTLLVRPPEEGYKRGETYDLKVTFAKVRSNMCYQFTIDS